MKRIIILLITLFTLTSYSQSNNIVSIDSTQIRLIGNKLYIAHQGFEKKNGAVNSTFWYTEVDLGNVFFKTSKSEFLPESYSTLNALVILLRDNSQFILKVDGHTDKVGNSIKNLKLSVNRAKAVKKYLFKKGIKLDRVVAKGMVINFLYVKLLVMIIDALNLL